jgi:hypothetical protein
MGAALAGTALLALAMMTLRADAGHTGAAPGGIRFLAILIALTPMWLLQSVVGTLRFELGFGDARTWLAAGLLHGLPVLVAWIVARSPADRVRRILLNSLLSLASTMIALAAFEAFLRLTQWNASEAATRREVVGAIPWSLKREPEPMFSMIPSHEWGHRYGSNERGYFDPDNSVRYKLNSAGFRDDEFREERDPSRLRVALLGDSFAFGEGVKREDTAAERIERILTQRAGCPVDVYNFAVPGYASIHEAWQLESTVSRYSPDLVVVWYFLNDVEVEGTMAFLGRDNPAIFFATYRRFSAVARFVGARLDGLLRAGKLVRTYEREYTDPEGAWKTARASLERISHDARESGSRPVLFVHPVLYRLDGGYPFRDIHDRVTAAARDSGFAAFDLLEAFSGHHGEELWVHPSDQHPNDIAHEIAAGFAAEKLAPLLGPCP